MQDALLFFSGKAVPTGILCQKVETLGFPYRYFDRARFLATRISCLSARLIFMCLVQEWQTSL